MLNLFSTPVSVAIPRVVFGVCRDPPKNKIQMMENQLPIYENQLEHEIKTGAGQGSHTPDDDKDRVRSHHGQTSVGDLRRKLFLLLVLGDCQMLELRSRGKYKGFCIFRLGLVRIGRVCEGAQTPQDVQASISKLDPRRPQIC